MTQRGKREREAEEGDEAVALKAGSCCAACVEHRYMAPR